MVTKSKLCTIYHVWECILIRFIMLYAIYIYLNNDIDDVKMNCRCYNNTNIMWKIGITIYHHDWYLVIDKIFLANFILEYKTLFKIVTKIVRYFVQHEVDIYHLHL